ncbi:MAG: alpha/beta hydrolase [Oscillospiraceae bacterium]|nr:alpha/beta hydrolase [Oscillospiraceae bacterium]
MNYLTYGKKQDKALVFIHGMASTALLCYEPILKYFENYYVVLAEVDGHSDNIKGDLISLKDCCDDIEKYINENLDGNIYGLCGFSMGATMAVELIGRGNISADKTVLDAAFTVRMGIKTKPFEICFSKAIKRIQQGKKIPQFLLDSVMGKGNNSVIEILYQDVSSETIINACEFVYKYDIPTGLSNYKDPVLFLRGSGESYPRKSAAILKNYLPQMEEKVFDGMGHGQYLHEHPAEYAKILLRFFNGRKQEL